MFACIGYNIMLLGNRYLMMMVIQLFHILCLKNLPEVKFFIPITHSFFFSSFNQDLFRYIFALVYTLLNFNLFNQYQKEQKKLTLIHFHYFF